MKSILTALQRAQLSAKYIITFLAYYSWSACSLRYRYMIPTTFAHTCGPSEKRMTFHYLRAQISVYELLCLWAYASECTLGYRFTSDMSECSWTFCTIKKRRLYINSFLVAFFFIFSLSLSYSFLHLINWIVLKVSESNQYHCVTSSITYILTGKKNEKIQDWTNFPFLGNTH